MRDTISEATSIHENNFYSKLGFDKITLDEEVKRKVLEVIKKTLRTFSAEQLEEILEKLNEIGKTKFDDLHNTSGPILEVILKIKNYYENDKELLDELITELHILEFNVIIEYLNRLLHLRRVTTDDNLFKFIRALKDNIETVNKTQAGGRVRDNIVNTYKRIKYKSKIMSLEKNLY